MRGRVILICVPSFFCFPRHNADFETAERPRLALTEMAPSGAAAARQVRTFAPGRYVTVYAVWAQGFAVA